MSGFPDIRAQGGSTKADQCGVSASFLDKTMIYNDVQTPLVIENNKIFD